MPDYKELWQHRTIWQERSAKDFASGGNTVCISPFYNCTDGAKDWAKAADTIVR